MGIGSCSCSEKNIEKSLRVDEMGDNNNKNQKKEFGKEEYDDNISETSNEKYNNSNPKSLKSSSNNNDIGTSKENELKDNLCLIYNEEGILESRIRFNNNSKMLV